MSKTKENKIYNINKRFKMYAAYDNIFEPIEMDISNLEISKETIYARESFEGNITSEPLVAVGAPAGENEVQLMTGATVSTNGVVTGVNAAREAFEENFNN